MAPFDFSGAFRPGVARRTTPFVPEPLTPNDFAFHPDAAGDTDLSRSGSPTINEARASNTANFGNAYAPSGVAMSPSSSGSQPDIVRDIYGPQLQDLSNQLRSAYAAPHAGVARQILGAFVSRRNPALGGIVSGETQRSQRIAPLEEAYQLTAGDIARERAQQQFDLSRRNIESEISSRDIQASAIPYRIQLEMAQAEAANYKEDPNLGLVDLRTKQPISNAAAAPLSAEEAQVLGKQPGERVPVKLKNTASEIVNRGSYTANTEEGVYRRNDQMGTNIRLGGQPRMIMAPENRIIPVVADPAHPDVITYARAGSALNNPNVTAPTSGPTKAAVAADVGEVPTKIGDQKVAFQTMQSHAQLLRDSMRALHNKNAQALNRLQNAFRTEFGGSGPITAQAIADAYGGEVTNVISKGHITDAEQAKTSKTLNPAAMSFAQIDGVLGAYQKLAQSKMDQLQKQIDFAKRQGGNVNQTPSQPETIMGIGITRDANGNIVGITPPK